MGEREGVDHDVLGVRGPPAWGCDLPLPAGLRRQTADGRHRNRAVRQTEPLRVRHQPAQKGEGSKEVHYTHRFVLSSEGGDTRLERTSDGDGNPVVGFLAKPAIMKDGRTSLGNLKARVEASA